MIQSKPKPIHIIISFLLIFNFAQAQDDSIKNTSVLWNKVEAYTSATVVLPNNYDSTKAHTLVIGLHGYGTTAKSFLSLSKPFTDAGFIYASPEAPYPVLRRDKTLGYEWFLYDLSGLDLLERPATNIEKAAMRLTTEQIMGLIINNLKEKYNVDQVYIAGMSQGGIITYLSGIHHPEKIDGMIIFSSVVKEDWLGNDTIENGKTVRSLIIHGNKDEAVPIKYAEDNLNLLLEHGYDVTFKEFDGGHIVPMHLMGFVIDWINKE
jgi:phospholipase/carboxylesterase